MIDSLTFDNFKSWSVVDNMRVAPVTGLFGTNSSGKTSIVQLLLMLKQTVESPDRAQVLNLGDIRTHVSLGGFKDIIYGHDTSRHLEFRLGWSPATPLVIVNPEKVSERLFTGNRLEFQAEIGESPKGTLVVESFSYSLNGSRFTMCRKADSEQKYELLADAGPFRFRRTPGRAWDLKAPVKCYGFPDQVKAYFQNASFLSDLELAFEDLFSSTYYLGPLREYPQRQYTWSGGEPQDVGRKGERVVDAILASRARGKTISRGKGKRRLTLEEHVAGWLRRLGLINRFSVTTLAEGSGLYQIRVQKAPRAAEVLITDVGFGVSQILPVLVLLFYVPIGSTVILEQPEIHLHPSVQAGLADVMIEAVQRRQIQIIVESHSEYLLQRLQRRIAEGQLSPSETALYFCDMPGNASRLTPLELDLFGNIANWPRDFFGDELGDLAAMAKAALSRKEQMSA